MFEPLLLAVLAVIAVIIWMTVRSRRAAAPAPGRSGKRDEAIDTVIGWQPTATRLLNPPERRAFKMLSQVLPDHLVMAHVPLSRFLRVPTRNSYQEWMRRVGQLCADFVVCDAGSQVIAVIELRPPAAEQTRRSVRRHDRMERVLRKAAIPVITWNSDALPGLEAVREQLVRKGAVASTTEGADTRSPDLEPLSMTPTVTGQARPHAVPVGLIVTTHTVDPTKADTPHSKLEQLLEELDRDVDAETPEPTPSTYFDDLDSGPTPLTPRKP